VPISDRDGEATRADRDAISTGRLPACRVRAALSKAAAPGPESRRNAPLPMTLQSTRSLIPSLLGGIERVANL